MLVYRGRHQPRISRTGRHRELGKQFSKLSGAELSMLYGDSGGNFNNIRVGSCGPYMGYTSSYGWDFCTGLGSPQGYLRQKSENQFR